MLEVQSSFDLNAVEKYHRRLAEHSTDTQLRIPTDLGLWRVGSYAALIHFVTNWAVRFEIPSVVLYANTMEQALSQTQNLGKTHHGVVAILGASDILLANKKPLPPEMCRMLIDDIMEFTYPPAKTRLARATMLPGIWRGRSVLFLCTYKRNQEFPPHLYHVSEHKKPEVKDPLDFRSLISRVIEALRQHHQSLTNPPGNIQTQVGEIIHELFKNTDEHARYDVKGDRISNAIRGISAALHINLGKSILGLSQEPNDSPIKEYFTRFESSGNYTNQSYLELNVFDNGPGLGEKWVGKPVSDLTVNEEWSAVQSCWGKGATTSDRLNKGYGLYRVASTLSDCRGFLRIRTGRFSLYRDFSTHPFPDSSIDPAEDLFSPKKLTMMDSITRSVAYEGATLLTPCNGLLLTMLIPIDLLSATKTGPVR